MAEKWSVTLIYWGVLRYVWIHNSRTQILSRCINWRASERGRLAKGELSAKTVRGSVPFTHTHSIVIRKCKFSWNPMVERWSMLYLVAFIFLIKNVARSLVGVCGWSKVGYYRIVKVWNCRFEEGKSNWYDCLAVCSVDLWVLVMSWKWNQHSWWES